MANAKMCDRCGAYYRDETKIWVKKNGVKRVISGAAFVLNDGSLDNYYDLCQGCIYDLIDFFKAYEQNEEAAEPEKKEEKQDEIHV